MGVRARQQIYFKLLLNVNALLALILQCQILALKLHVLVQLQAVCLK